MPDTVSGRRWSQLSREATAEVGYDAILDLPPVDQMSEQALHGCDAPVGETARHNQVKIPQVGPDVEGEPMARHPPRDADSDGGNLFVADPDTGQALNPPCLDAKVCNG